MIRTRTALLRNAFAALAAITLAGAGLVVASPSFGGTPSSLVSAERDYLLHKPAGTSPAGKPLIVMLHGCGGDVRTAPYVKSLIKQADARGFTAVFPQQPASINGGCWQWQFADHQSRGSGEPAVIAGITKSVRDQVGADPRRVYVWGFSAGGAMTSVMGATYPDLYAAIGVFAGTGYRLGDGWGAYRAMGSHARVVPTLIGVGTLDVINIVQGTNLAKSQWLSANDLADDGKLNFSIPGHAARSEHHAAPPVPPGSGKKSFAYSIDHYVDGAKRPLLDYWSFHGLDHTVPDGISILPNFTPHVVDFFAAHPRR